MRFFSNATAITKEEIDQACLHFDIALPDALRALIMEHNGATWENNSGMVDSLISFSRNDAYNVFEIDFIPTGYLPFADDGMEGVFAIEKGTGRIVHFWSDESTDEVAEDFSSFLSKIDVNP